MKQALRVLAELADKEIASGKVEIRSIEGMTIENRAAKLESVPADVLPEIKKCDVLLKEPMRSRFVCACAVGLILIVLLIGWIHADYMQVYYNFAKL